MDPLTLATAAVSLLVPHLARVAGRVAGSVSEDLDDAVAERIDRLYQSVRTRLSGDPLAGGALAQLQAQPEDGCRQGSVQYALAHLVQIDPAFGAALARLVDDARPVAGARPQVAVSNSGATAVRGNVTITANDGCAVGRDAVFGHSASRRED
jgi:hypothetical protein